MTTEPAAQRAYSEIKLRIIRGDLVGGTWLSETTVCEELGLSRTPVHEAFLRLEAEELLSLQARKGAIVRAMSPSEVRDVIEMRETIETSCARRAIEGGALPAVLETLDDLVAEQERALEAGDTDAFVTADDAFHTAVVDAAGNPIASHFMRLLADRAQRLRYHAVRLNPEQLTPILHGHRELADALRASDADAYSAAMTRHLDILDGQR